MLVAQYMAASTRGLHWWPVVVPDQIVRDGQGAILGCQGFAVAVPIDHARSWGVLEDQDAAREANRW